MITDSLVLDVYDSVDSTNYLIEEPIPLLFRWFSHKFCGPSLSFEGGVLGAEGKIDWLNRPFACRAWPDPKIVKLRMLHFLSDSGQVAADGSYQNSRCIISTWSSPELKRFYALVRS